MGIFPRVARCAQPWAAGHNRVFSKQPVNPIERCHAIRLGHGRIIEGGVNKVFQGIGGCLLGHDRLTDVNDLARLITKAVNAENFQRVTIE